MHAVIIDIPTNVSDVIIKIWVIIILKRSLISREYMVWKTASWDNDVSKLQPEYMTLTNCQLITGYKLTASRIYDLNNLLSCKTAWHKLPADKTA